jgi:acetaldehyde dehydrogenase/alcohol dehydrogenase
MGTFSQYTYPNAVKKYAEMAENLGINGDNNAEKADGLIAYIKKLKQKLNIKGSIQEYGIDEKSFLSSVDEMSKMAFDDQCTGANPRYPLISEIKNMYINAYYGK